MPEPEKLLAADPDSASNNFPHSPILSEENLRHLDFESPSPLSPTENTHIKDSPLTDIGTSPPPFELTSLGERRSHSRDNYESSELSDLGDDDDSEAETDKMDFLNEDLGSRLGDRVSDLHRLSDLTDLANLQELDSDDSDAVVNGNMSSVDSVASEVPNPVVPDHDESMIANGSLELSKRQFEADTDDIQANGTKSTSSDSGHESENEPSQESEGTSDAELGELSRKKRKLNGSHAPENGLDVANSEKESVINPESTLVKDIIQDGAEPVSWPAASSVVVAVTSNGSGTAQEETYTAELLPEKSLSDTELLKSEADVDEGATADVEDTVKQDTNEDQEIYEQREELNENGVEDAPCSGSGNENENENEDEDEDENNTPDSEEDVDLDEQRRCAVEELISIEKDFSFLRDKLYRDKLSLLEHEMQLCLDGLHPELLQIYYKVNEFYQDNIKMANATLNYSLKCINTETIATRTSIHQNFMKDLGGTRNDMITETTSSWYKINKEWNYLDLAVSDYNFTALPSLTSQALNMPHVVGGSSAEYYQDNGPLNKKMQKHNTIVELVHQRNSLNAQLGILDGLKEFHGIPCAVSNSLLNDEDLPVEELLLRKASPDEVQEDLIAMGIY